MLLFLKSLHSAIPFPAPAPAPASASAPAPSSASASASAPCFLSNTLQHSKPPPLCTSLGYSRAFYELFEGAIYMHRAKQFLVHKLDLGSKRALCKPARVGYYTACRSLSMPLSLPLSLPYSSSCPCPRADLYL